MSRHAILLLLLRFAAATLSGTEAPEPSESSPVVEPADLIWHRPAEWGAEGRALAEHERSRWFDRLPATAENRVTDKVWQLSRDSAGMLVRFRTDATFLWVDYTLLRGPNVGSNQTAIGGSGVDLYARDDAGRWRWVGVTRPTRQHVRQEFARDLAPGVRDYALYLPLRNGIEELAIGIPSGANFERQPPRAAKPIVFYGTSITHGASASRPGMTHVAILGRRLDHPVINLGFSGNGRMDSAVGEYLTQIDAAIYVIDCLPNMNPALVREKCPPLIRQLRAARPDTPIVLVEDRRKSNAWISPKLERFHSENHAALRECFEILRREGVTGLHYLPGDGLLGDDNEATTDGSHPSDLGFVRQADSFEPLLRQILATLDS